MVSTRLCKTTLVTYFTKLVVVLDQIKHNFYCTLVHAHLQVIILSQQIWRHYGGKVPRVHLIAGFFIHRMERRNPVEEAKQDFHGIAMSLW
jgi:hypothetical protein